MKHWLENAYQKPSLFESIVTALGALTWLAVACIVGGLIVGIVGFYLACLLSSI